MNQKYLLSIFLLYSTSFVNAQSNKVLKARIDSMEKRIIDLLDAITELEKRPKFDPTDTDDDGVIDMFDLEPNTPVGARVDTRGVTLDSDGDGIPDYKDKEPFSPPGYKVDSNGVALVPKPAYVTEADADRMADAKLEKFKFSFRKQERQEEQHRKIEVVYDFYQIITYDKFKTEIDSSDEVIEALEKTRHFLENQPSYRVVITGYATEEKTDKKNQLLSYKRALAAVDYLVKHFGVNRYSLVLNYDIANKRLYPSLKYDNLRLNRRIEIEIAKVEGDMSPPTND